MQYSKFDLRKNIQILGNYYKYMYIYLHIWHFKDGRDMEQMNGYGN